MSRSAERRRTTAETDVRVRLDLDGSGQAKVATGVPFFDHMLSALAHHGLFDLEIEAEGDLEVDAHHTVEDVGIVLGDVLQQALGDRTGIERFGTTFVPMDEALCQVSLDLSNRPYLAFSGSLGAAWVGHFDTALVEEFLRALSVHGGITLHVQVHSGKNAHHIIEALFKALGIALKQATRTDPRRSGVPSTKGSLVDNRTATPYRTARSS
ncbi:MAG: imidazoleglycerol-phosphate dehydratase HisB [Firmicutes bacterium]|nr:imidazoleglycerol-phosphate dehydratase HisB [Bacillota bacterium]